MHAECAAFLIIRHRLDHGAKDVGIDLRPVEAADVEEVGAGHLGEPRHVHAAGEEPAIHIGEEIRPALDVLLFTLVALGIHGAEQLGKHLVGI